MEKVASFESCPAIKKSGDNMPLRYKVDILQALKEKGYNTNRLRKEKLLSEGALQRLRHADPVSWSNIEQLCRLLKCQPNDIIEYVEDGSGDNAAADGKE